MLKLQHVVIFSSLLCFARPFKPDCVTNNQFRFSCFSIAHCNKRRCEPNWCGYHFNSTVVKIVSAPVLPKCAFAEAPFLKQVIGRNQGIKIVAKGAFVNLPSLEIIDLSINEITSLHEGTFANVAATSLDLSWNKLQYIPQGAFIGLPKLQHLNLSRNELQTFPVHQLPKSIVNINLSHNLFTRFVLSSNKAPSLASLDLSHNQLSKLALQFETLLKKIDISKNQLSSIDFADVSECEVVKINANRFSTVPDLLRVSSLKQVAISPNPWKCDELEKLWPILSMNSVKILDDGAESQPICGNVEFETRLLHGSGKLEKHCQGDVECDEGKICRSTSCVNPCNENVCDSSRSCKISSHRLLCSCKENWKEDPENPLGPCQDVDCFTSLDCARPGAYCQNNTCNLPPGAFFPTTVRPPHRVLGVVGGGGDGGDAQGPSDGTKWWEYDI